MPFAVKKFDIEIRFLCVRYLEIKNSLFRTQKYCDKPIVHYTGNDIIFLNYIYITFLLTYRLVSLLFADTPSYFKIIFGEN